VLGHEVGIDPSRFGVETRSEIELPAFMRGKIRAELSPTPQEERNAHRPLRQPIGNRGAL
jgi:hypothetical protein